MILAIETSCDETAAAVTSGRKVLSNEIYSQVLVHQKWGGVVPSLAKRAHEERIDAVIEAALKKSLSRNINFRRRELGSRHRQDRSSPVGRSLPQTFTSDENIIASAMKDISHIAVTHGPGLAIALEVGIRKAKELCRKYRKKLVAVNHMEGHIYSCFVQSSGSRLVRPFEFPYLALLVSGGHTELVLFNQHVKYQVVGETLDDAAGESLDKAAKMLGLGYPGGPIIERLARDGDSSFLDLPIPMARSGDLNFSYSGLKTAFLYKVRVMSDRERNKHLADLAASFQQAVIDSLLFKLERAMKKFNIYNVCVGGGVVANQELRGHIRKLVKKHKGKVLFPTYKSLYGDNAAMIGVAAHFKAEKGIFVQDLENLDRVPRASLNSADFPGVRATFRSGNGSIILEK
ncbi:MAG: tRNA (adenosine(37)-N6)-threonylcarbamoyltransferase complex transferase subunit TsaD [Candidatus Paceibacterota bacterium]